MFANAQHIWYYAGKISLVPFLIRRREEGGGDEKMKIYSKLF